MSNINNDDLWGTGLFSGALWMELLSMRTGGFTLYEQVTCDVIHKKTAFTGNISVVLSVQSSAYIPLS